MKILLPILALSAVVITGCQSKPQPPKYVQIFDGRTSAGWDGDFAKTWRIRDGAFVGGSLKLAPELYRPLVGVVLLLAAVRLFWQPERLAAKPVHAPSFAITLPVGAGLGLLAGLTGTGGGIFLSPLIILFGWEDARKTSGIAATLLSPLLFFVLNYLAVLTGYDPQPEQGVKQPPR